MSDYDPTSIEGLPEAGIARLEQNKRGLFTSDLSVAEFLLVKEAGFDPLGLVVGSSIFHIGFQQSSWKVSEEMQVLSEAMYSARELAMTRMEEEADQLGAGGLVGMAIAHDVAVREVEQNDVSREDLIVTFHVLGTAIAPHGEHRPLQPQTIVRLGAKRR